MKSDFITVLPQVFFYVKVIIFSCVDCTCEYLFSSCLTVSHIYIMSGSHFHPGSSAGILLPDKPLLLSYLPLTCNAC